MYKVSHNSYAPFGSVSLRSRKEKKKSQTAPGPGSYDVSLPMINPIVKTIRKDNNNIIIKLSHIGTASFQSDDRRFKGDSEVNVGPGKYNPESSFEQYQKKKQKIHRNVAGQKVRQMLKNSPNRIPAITQVKNIQINEYVQMPKIIKKQEQKKKVNKLHGSIWSKMTEARGKQMQSRSISSLGPGQYQKNIVRQEDYHCPSAAFKSESIRSFFDNIYFQTNQEKLAKLREVNHYKSQKIGPAEYNVEQEKKFAQKYQFFGSTEQRKM